MVASGGGWRKSTISIVPPQLIMMMDEICAPSVESQTWHKRVWSRGKHCEQCNRESGRQMAGALIFWLQNDLMRGSADIHHTSSCAIDCLARSRSSYDATGLTLYERFSDCNSFCAQCNDRDDREGYKVNQSGMSGDYDIRAHGEQAASTGDANHAR
jgi:hypothetical protein